MRTVLQNKTNYLPLCIVPSLLVFVDKSFFTWARKYSLGLRESQENFYRFSMNVSRWKRLYASRIFLSLLQRLGSLSIDDDGNIFCPGLDRLAHAFKVTAFSHGSPGFRESRDNNDRVDIR